MKNKGVPMIVRACISNPLRKVLKEDEPNVIWKSPCCIELVKARQTHQCDVCELLEKVKLFKAD